MPVEGHNPIGPGTDRASETPGDGPPQSPPPSAETQGATLEQVAPPAWVEHEDTSSHDSRSGKQVYDLNREIERNQASGADDSADGYALLRKLGTGSFGVVWEAENRLTGERVAIKFFTADDADWAKLLGEVGLLQTVEGCRGIVMVKEVRQGSPTCRPHYVMQLANSGSLADWLKTADTLSTRERVKLAVGFFTGVARAMAAVHRRGIHHCDLKPQNILLHAPEPGSLPGPLVADFGQAHLATDDTPALGTFFYMPPDQIEAAQVGTPPDTRWDVYALGAVVYEMLTGVPPRRTPELVERIKKSPRHLPTRMSIYREGILAAPEPTAHRTSADPMLAKIIDRCLALRPDQRPPDAGALVALLDSRARWRRSRPLLGLAIAATLLFIGLIGGAGAWSARVVTRESEQNVSAELAGSLARTAGYSVPALERRLRWHVKMLEETADQAPGNVRQALVRHGNGPHGAGLPPDAIPLADRQLLANWLGGILEHRKQVGFNADSIASVALMLVADADQPVGSRGFLVARAHPDGSVEHATQTDQPEIYGHDFSFRDYFHGGGSLLGEEGKPHAVIRATHICNPYRSRGDDRLPNGQRIHQPWKVDVVTPIWEKEPGGRVIGLLSFGLNLERDVVSLLVPLDLGAKGSEHLGITRKVKVVLIDDRNQWVWHPDCRGSLATDRPDLRLPHDYPQLARAHGFDPATALPWLQMTSEGRSYVESSDYVDFVEAERENDEQNLNPEIACFTRFSPYADSKYAEAKPKQWVFVAQVDRKTALQPLRELRNSIVRIGAIVGAILSLLAIGLWIGLVRVLRRLEFATHG